ARRFAHARPRDRRRRRAQKFASHGGLREVPPPAPQAAYEDAQVAAAGPAATGARGGGADGGEAGRGGRDGRGVGRRADGLPRGRPRAVRRPGRAGARGADGARGRRLPRRRQPYHPRPAGQIARHCNEYQG
ncbi:MAG: low-specificity D-threonine aldolase, partial [uncultured Phycisphaerae bacterium]